MVTGPVLQRELEMRGYGAIRSRQSLAGGSINAACRLDCDNGSVFLKTGADAGRDHFRAEARSLEVLAGAGAIRTPEVLVVADDYLVLEYIEPGSRTRSFWRRAGTALADLHRQSGESFGLEFDNYCGATPQPNSPTADGHEFFASHRLAWQGRLARDAGLLDRSELVQLDSICRRLDSLVPVMPAVLIHGDLWTGNLMATGDGEPVLVDPACHYGWAEADLAMTCLFGGFDEGFYKAYEANSDVSSNWRERTDLYNLYHLLNHLNLFGSGFHGQVRAVLKKYA